MPPLDSPTKGVFDPSGLPFRWCLTWSERRVTDAPHRGVGFVLTGGSRACGRDQRTEPVWRLCGRPLETFAPLANLVCSGSEGKADAGAPTSRLCGASITRRSDQVRRQRKGSPEGSKTPLAGVQRAAPSGGVQGRSPWSPEAKRYPGGVTGRERGAGGDAAE